MALLLVLAALAQSPADRVAIESLRDSLALVTDSVALARLEATTIELAKQRRDDPLVHLRLGFIADRLGDLTKNKSHYGDAAGEFERAGELRPRWPYPWDGLRPSELAVGGDSVVAIANSRQMLGKGCLSKAAESIARAAYLGRRATEGWSAYFNGMRVATSPAALGLYRSDLSWIADSTDLKTFDALATPGERAAWLDEFWNKRDVVQARDVGERLAEHYRRWFYARHNFRLVRRHRHYDITEVYRPNQAEFDDRGMIYIRHGEPDRRARFLCREPEEPNGEGCAANESWLYRRREGDLVFHFVARGDVQDYKLVESLADVLGFRRAVRASMSLDPEVPALYQTRDAFGPLYDRVARSQHAAGTELAEDRIQGRRNITLGTSSDSYAQRFDQVLDVVA